jgi:hypothetical protein
MTRYLVIMAAFFAAVTMAGLRPAETVAIINTTHNMNQQPPTLLHLLAEMGKAYDCYFTVESAWNDAEPFSLIEASIVESSLMPSPIRSSEDKTKMQATLDALKQGMPNLTFMRDQSDERIIHVIDSRLSNLEGYGLAYTVKNLEFSGPVWGLLKYMNAQGIPVVAPRSMSLHQIGSYSSETIVQVKGQNSQVRTLLSNCIPPDVRNSILWTARTKLARGAVSQILFSSVKK